MENQQTDGWIDFLLTLVRDHIALTEPIVFALGFAESIVFLSMLVPSTALFLGIGGAHSAMGGIFWPVWIAGASGAFFGDMVSFFLGRRWKKNVTRTWPLNKNPRWVAYARLSISRYGVVGIIASKFLGMARPFVPVIAGSMGMAWPKFAFASAVSSLAWAGVFLAPGYGLVWFLSR